MIKVSVVSTKELFKTAKRILVVIILLATILQVINYSKKNLGQIELDTNKCISYLTDEIIVMGNLNPNNFFNVSPTQIMDSEIIIPSSIFQKTNVSVKDDEIQLEDIIEQNQIPSEVQEAEKDEIKDVDINVETKVQKSTYKETYNYKIEGVKIKNETEFNLDRQSLSSEDVTLKNKNVIVFHTHTCESYTQTDENKYEESGNYRTTDLTHSVARVGDELQKYLKSYGFNVIHDKTFHDYPAYTGSYGRSLKTVSKILSRNKDTDIIIDLHRDAMSDETYAPKVKIGEELVAQVMFVIGTNGSGLDHENWKKNLEFAIKVQKKANEMYPGLFKPIILRNARYNQHLSQAATIIEFGATGNTLEECEASARYLAKVLDAVY